MWLIVNGFPYLVLQVWLAKQVLIFMGRRLGTRAVAFCRRYL